MIFPVIAIAAATLASSPDAFDRVTAALAASYTQAGRSHAGHVLTATGARPLDDGPDLALTWAHGRNRSPVYRERALGPAYKRVTIGSGAVVRFGQTFLAGRQARVAIVPDMAGRFELGVTDDDGAVQCAARRAGRCDWVPLWTTRFQIELKNPGPNAASCYIIVE